MKKRTRNRPHCSYLSDAEREVLERRRKAIPSTNLLSVERKNEGTGPRVGAYRQRMATIGSIPYVGFSNSPALCVSRAIRNALNPDLAPKPVKTFAQMPPEEQAEMRRLYEKKP